jgi:hypothetical protein
LKENDRMSEKVVNMDVSKYAPVGWVPGAGGSNGPDPFSVSGVQDRKAVTQRLQASRARFEQSEYQKGFDNGARWAANEAPYYALRWFDANEKDWAYRWEDVLDHARQGISDHGRLDGWIYERLFLFVTEEQRAEVPPCSEFWARAFNHELDPKVFSSTVDELKGFCDAARKVYLLTYENVHYLPLTQRSSELAETSDPA